MPYTVANSLDDAARRIREFLADALPEITSLAAADIVACRDSLTIVLGHVERIRRELSRQDAERRVA